MVGFVIAGSRHLLFMSSYLIFLSLFLVYTVDQAQEITAGQLNIGMA